MKWVKKKLTALWQRETLLEHVIWNGIAFFLLQFKTHFTEGLMRLKTEYEQNYCKKVNKSSAREYCLTELRRRRRRRGRRRRQQQHPYSVCAWGGTIYYVRWLTGKIRREAAEEVEVEKNIEKKREKQTYIHLHVAQA